MADPRDGIALPPRDYEALAFIGRGYEVAQYQLREAVFPGLSEVVGSRRVRRWADPEPELGLGLIAIDRWMRVGINRLRLTAKGRELLVASGVATEDELFVPSKPVALKDISHTLWINDLRVLALQGVPFRATSIAPAWLLQRRLQPAPAAIPDLLLTAKAAHGRKGRLLAYEVDLGTERLSVFLPKLVLLTNLLQEWAGDEASAGVGVIVLTRGPRRLESLRRSIDELALAVPIVADELPSATGVAALNCLRALLSRGVQTNAQPGGSK